VEQCSAAVVTVTKSVAFASNSSAETYRVKNPIVPL